MLWSLISNLFTIDTAPLNKPSKPSIIQGRMGWEAFRSQLVNQIDLKIRLKSRKDIDDVVNFLLTSIQQADPPLLRTHSVHNLIHLPIIFHILPLISDKRKAHATWKRTKYLPDKQLFDHPTNKAKRILA